MRRRVLFGLVVAVLLATGLVAMLLTHRRTTGRNVVKLGAILPMTGTAADYGELMRRGITIATDEFNANAGKSAVHLEVVIEDSRSNPKDGVSAMQKLLQVDRVPAVMPALSGIVLACVPLAERNHVVLLNCPANSPKLRGAGAFVFNLTILSDQESAFLADYAYNKMGARTAGILFVNNESGRGYRDSFADKFTALGGSVKLSEGHEQGATDFRTIVEKFRSARVDLVFLCSYYSESALFLRQAKELGYRTKWLSYSSVETPDFLKLVGDAAEGLIFSQPGLDVNASDEITRKFVTEYRNRYGQDPDFWSAQFYEGTRLLGSAVSADARTGEEFRTYLKNLGGFQGLTGPITFDSNGCVSTIVRFKTISSGTFRYFGE